MIFTCTRSDIKATVLKNQIQRKQRKKNKQWEKDSEGTWYYTTKTMPGFRIQ